MKKLILTFCLGCLSLHIMAQEILVETLFFESSKSQLTIISKEQLNQLIKQIKLKEISVVSIVGHTDCEGSDAYNITLSKERASTVLNYLQSNVSDFKPIEITYKGELQPKEKNTSELGKQQNRRVEIRYIKK